MESFEPVVAEPKKKRRWDRWLYLSVLALLLLSFIKYITWPWIFFSADGVLYSDQFDVKFMQDIRLLSIETKEGASVKAGDTLFFYEEYRLDNQGQTRDSLEVEMKANGNAGSLIAVQGQLAKRKLLRKEAQKRLQFWQQEFKRKQELVYLGVLQTGELSTIERTMDDIQFQINAYQAEIQALQGELVQLQRLAGQGHQLALSKAGIQVKPQVYISPKSGLVDRIRIRQQDVAYKQEIITSIVDSSYTVRAYIDFADLERFKVGDEVMVMLPYGNRKLQGHITKMYTVGEDKERILFNALDQEKYGVVVEVKPIEEGAWGDLRASNMPVKIRKGRVNL